MEPYYRAVVPLAFCSHLVPVHHFVFVPVRLVNHKRKSSNSANRVHKKSIALCPLFGIRHLPFFLRGYIATLYTANNWWNSCCSIRKQKSLNINFNIFMRLRCKMRATIITVDAPFSSYSTFPPNFVPALLPREDKCDRLETLTLCAEWSKFTFRYFFEIWPKIKQIGTFKIFSPTARLWETWFRLAANAVKAYLYISDTGWRKQTAASQIYFAVKYSAQAV